MKLKRIFIIGILLFFYSNVNAQNLKLYGTFCSYSSSGYSSSSSYSSSEHVTFDGNGHYRYSSNSSYSGDGSGYYGNDGGSGGSYRVQGRKVILTSSEGEVFVAYVHFAQANGIITELQYSGTLYAKALCD